MFLLSIDLSEKSTNTSFKGKPALPNALASGPGFLFAPTWHTGAKRVAILPDEQPLMHQLLEDPENKLSPEFPISPALYSRVAFWMAVYSMFPKDIRIVHDRDNLEIIYGYLDVSPLFRQWGRTEKAEKKIAQAEKWVLAQIQKKISGAVKNDPSAFEDISELVDFRNFLSRYGSLSKARAEILIDGIRTQSGQKDMFLLAVQRSRTILPHIDAVLAKLGLPKELGRIPFVESSFDQRAQSKVAAFGIWQLMPDTARELLGPMESGRWSDPIRQTQAAAKLLYRYRAVLPDWGTTITSYNSGVGRVRGILDENRITSIEELLNLEDDEGLGFAGKNFYAEVLAANLTEAYKDRLFGEKLHTIALDLKSIFKGVKPFPLEACEL